MVSLCCANLPVPVRFVTTSCIICRILKNSRAVCTVWHMATSWQLLPETTRRSEGAQIACSSCTHSQDCLLSQEMEQQQAANKHQQIRDIDIDDLLDDPELERLHAERLAVLQQENEKRQQLQRKGHGEYQEVEEGQQLSYLYSCMAMIIWTPRLDCTHAAGDFLESVTKTDKVVCHFFHRDFERCKVLDKHLAILARKYFDTRFIKVSAPVSLSANTPSQLAARCTVIAPFDGCLSHHNLRSCILCW